MPRPKLCRRICGYPDYWSFAPEDSEPDETIPLMLDEFETIRLIDHQKLTQEECAAAMGVSRATITSIYESARYKVADAMVNGKRIRITGGTYRMDEVPAAAGIKEKGENIMRIAVTYENGMVGQHFGRTEQFKLYDVEDGKIVNEQIVDTNGSGHGALAGFLQAAKADALICGGIGMGAQMALADAGIKLYGGVQGSADKAAKALAEGNLEYDPDAHCDHHGHHHDGDCGHEHCGEHNCAGN